MNVPIGAEIRFNGCRALKLDAQHVKFLTDGQGNAIDYSKSCNRRYARTTQQCIEGTPVEVLKMPVQLNPNVTFSLAASISCASAQEEHDRNRHAETLAWHQLIARVHAGEINPTTTLGKRLLSLVPMHTTLQEPMAWASVFSVTPAL